MRLAWATGALLAALGPVACLGGTFACEDDSQCALDGQQGVCAARGCALPDDSCPSGLRYHDSAPGGLGGECVESGGSTSTGEATTTTSATSDESSDGSEESTAGVGCPTPPCGCIASIGGGYGHHCAIRTDGALFCWGDNEAGEVGIGTMSDNVPAPSMVQIGDGGAVESVVARNATCALTDLGTVWCWGPNGNEVSDPSQPNGQVLEPRQITIPVAADRVRIGQESACAGAENGPLACWGDAEFGELGAGTNNEPGPVEVMHNIFELVEIGLGQDHTCVLDGNGDVFCWGSNALGQLSADAQTMQSDDPVQVPLSSTASQLAVGQNHACARTSGNIECWGHNDKSQVGADAMNPIQRDPVQVDVTPLDGPPVAMPFFQDRSCILTDQASVYCWGTASNATYAVSKYEFGTPEPTPQRIPATDDFPEERVVQVQHGSNHMCVRTDHFRAYCWGDNRDHVYGPNDIEDGRSSVELELPCP